MREIIDAVICSDHFLKCSTYSIARNGEGLTPCLSVSIPNNLINNWAYIDFKKPNGETFKTPKIDTSEGKVVYNIPLAVLDVEGKLEVQVVFQNEKGEIWKTYVKEFAVRYSINATDDIPDKEDFITEAQKLINEAVEIANSIEKRANNGEFDGQDGKDYVLTDEDKKEIADMVKPARVLITSGDTITLADNTTYYAEGVISELTINYPNNDYICSLEFTLSSTDDITIKLPDTSKYIGGTPTFAKGETWELNIKNGVVVGGLIE